MGEYGRFAVSKYLTIDNSENTNCFINIRHKRASSTTSVRDMAGVELDIDGHKIVITKTEWKDLKRLINDEIKPY